MTLGTQYIDAIEAGDTQRAEQLAEQLNAEADAERKRIDSITLISSALYYASLGIPVHPLRPGLKTPATPHGFKDATTDQDRIRAYWQRNPDANIGLATGHRFSVIDIDGPAGLEFMYGDDNPPPRIESLTVLGVALTAKPSGRHIYVPVDDRLGKNSAKQIHPEIDTRGLGGYVVAAPSVVNGRKYKWLFPLALP